MNDKRLLVFLLFLPFFSASGQKSILLPGVEFKIKADSLFRVKNFTEAARLYLREFETRTMSPFKKAALVNSAYCFAKAGDKDSALCMLRLAAFKYGYKDKNFLTSDSIMLSLKIDNEYKRIIKKIDEDRTNMRDYTKASINTTDIDLFWSVYDSFIADTSDAASRFLFDYFSKGSEALQEYYRLKTRNIGGINGFASNMKTMRKFYEGIRANTLRVPSFKDSIYLLYKKLSGLYENAVFPPLNFHIGGWSSGGTYTDYGLHVGVDIYSNDEHTDKSELDSWQKRNGAPQSSLIPIIAHELIHAQQTKMRQDTTLLMYVIQEGMGDFLGEMISGRMINSTLHQFAKGKEQMIWNKFAEEMLLNRYSNWIGNSSQETPDWPADLGYWIGYQICKRFYQNSPDKKRAIQEMLEVRDYNHFLSVADIVRNPKWD
jgi:hypothetical protein